MAASPTLPEAPTSRPLRHSDSRSVFELVAAQALHDAGHTQIEEADPISPGFEPWNLRVLRAPEHCALTKASQ